MELPEGYVEYLEQMESQGSSMKSIVCSCCRLSMGLFKLQGSGGRSSRRLSLLCMWMMEVVWAERKLFASTLEGLSWDFSIKVWDL